MSGLLSRGSTAVAQEVVPATGWIGWLRVRIEMNLADTKFPLGRLVATRNAASQLSPADVAVAVGRHSSGDWGEVCEEDQASNEEALVEGLRLMSVYTGSSGIKFWIITEWDRSITTVLLPEDY